MKRLASVVLMLAWSACGDDGAAQNSGGSSDDSAGSQASASQGNTASTAGGTSSASTGMDSGLEGKEGLVRIEDWRPDAEEGSDPFGPRPMGTACDIGFGLEGGLFEIDSGLCTWGTFVQPSLAPIAAGDSLEFVLVHDALFSEQEGVFASVGVAVGPDILWEQEIPIPSEPAFLRPVFEAPADAPVGTPLRFHVHNHGVNNYRLVDFTVTHP